MIYTDSRIVLLIIVEIITCIFMGDNFIGFPFFLKKVCGDVSSGILLCKMSKFIICWECAPRKSMQTEPQRIFMIPWYIDLNIHVNLF